MNLLHTRKYRILITILISFIIVTLLYNRKEEPEVIVEEIIEPKEYDPATDFHQIRSLSPIIIFSKTFCPYSLKIKALLKNYQILPQPHFIELDMHLEGKLLQSYIGEVTGRSTVPNVIIGLLSESRGGSDTFLQLHDDYLLEEQIKIWGGGLIDVLRVEVPSNA